MVALKDELTDEGPAVVGVAHGLSQKKRILNLGIVCQSQMTEHVV